jgi:hypothetical protein
MQKKKKKKKVRGGSSSHFHSSHHFTLCYMIHSTVSSSAVLIVAPFVHVLQKPSSPFHLRHYSLTVCAKLLDSLMKLVPGRNVRQGGLMMFFVIHNHI